MEDATAAVEQLLGLKGGTQAGGTDAGRTEECVNVRAFEWWRERCTRQQLALQRGSESVCVSSGAPNIMLLALVLPRWCYSCEDGGCGERASNASVCARDGPRDRSKRQHNVLLSAVQKPVYL
jgi:hypothetical protein